MTETVEPPADPEVGDGNEPEPDDVFIGADVDGGPRRDPRVP